MSASTPIDLRSDTVTRPTPAMREAMARAPVGDDVLGDEPTVTALQEKAAALLGKEAALYVPSGTMANLCAIRGQTEPGDEIIAHVDSHFFLYESGAFAAIAGCSVRLTPGARGIYGPDALDSLVRAPAVHFPRTRLVVIENTHNRGGGSVWPLEQVAAVTGRARELGLRCHLDGARLLNACVATGLRPPEYTRHFDTVSLCFSKGLGAPVGSVVAGDRATVARLDRFRKMFGGTMRQSGIIAAGAIYALDHHIDRLADDHAKARRFAERLAEVDGISLDLEGVQTNMVFFEVDPRLGTAAEFCQGLERRGVRMFSVGPQRIRAVFHLDVSAAQSEEAAEIIAAAAASLSAPPAAARA
jgi:threonine aldolase